MGMWAFILFYSTVLLSPCDACGQLNIRNEIAGRQVEGFIVKKYDKDHCNSNNAISYTVPEDGETTSIFLSDIVYDCQIEDTRNASYYTSWSNLKSNSTRERRAMPNL